MASYHKLSGQQDSQQTIQRCQRTSRPTYPATLPPTQTPIPLTHKCARRPTRTTSTKGLDRVAGFQKGGGGEYQGRPRPQILFGPQASKLGLLKCVAKEIHHQPKAEPLPVGCSGHQRAQGSLPGGGTAATTSDWRRSLCDSTKSRNSWPSMTYPSHIMAVPLVHFILFVIAKTDFAIFKIRLVTISS